MAKATYAIWDGENFNGLVWETEIGRIITIQGNINPQMGFMVRDCETGENVVSKDFVDILAEILPFEKEEIKKAF